MGILDDPRYKENPLFLFFEDLILDVMGCLPAGDHAKIQAMDLQRIFKTTAALPWRKCAIYSTPAASMPWRFWNTWTPKASPGGWAMSGCCARRLRRRAP